MSETGAVRLPERLMAERVKRGYTVLHTSDALVDRFGLKLAHQLIAQSVAYYLSVGALKSLVASVPAVQIMVRDDWGKPCDINFQSRRVMINRVPSAKTMLRYLPRSALVTTYPTAKLDFMLDLYDVAVSLSEKLEAFPPERGVAYVGYGAATVVGLRQEAGPKQRHFLNQLVCMLVYLTGKMVDDGQFDDVLEKHSFLIVGCHADYKQVENVSPRLPLSVMLGVATAHAEPPVFISKSPVTLPRVSPAEKSAGIPYHKLSPTLFCNSFMVVFEENLDK